MIVFITSLRHPQNSNSFRTVELLLERTLASVCAQTVSEFHVIVVCKTAPDIAHDPTKVEFLEVDFPPPSTTGGPQTGIQAVRFDKGTKLMLGFLRAAKYSPTHVMFFDADDRVSNRLAGHVRNHPSSNGWYLYNGYTYTEGGSIVKKKRNFHLLCGTSHIIRYDLIRRVTAPMVMLDQAALIDHYGERFIKNIIGCHMTIKMYFQSLDQALERLPFSGAVWVLNTGENHSGSQAITFGRALTPEIRREFSLGDGSGRASSNWWRENVSGLVGKARRLLHLS